MLAAMDVIEMEEASDGWMDGRTRVGTGELLELLGLDHGRASDLDGALGGDGGHLGGGHAEGRSHCERWGGWVSGWTVMRMKVVVVVVMGFLDGVRWTKRDRWEKETGAGSFWSRG